MARTSHFPKALLGLCVLCLTFSQHLIAQSLSPSDDAQVDSTFPAVNFGNVPYLEAGGTAQTYVRFDLSSLPGGFSLPEGSRVNLVLWVNRIGTAGSVQVATASGAWTEAAITSNNQPGGIPIGDPLPVSTGGQFVFLDVTNTVQQWLTETPNNGFVIAGVAGTNVFFDSKESVTTSHQPVLQFVAAGPQGVPGPQGAAGAQGAQGAAGAQGAQGPQGAAGAQGAQGPQGAAGAQGPQGVPGATGSLPQVSVFNVGTTYNQGDVVFNAGSTYQSSANANTGNLPANGAPWTLIAQAGATGPQGAAGAQGAQGPQGAAGAQGAQGPQGVQGAVGPAGPTGPSPGMVFSATYFIDNQSVDPAGETHFVPLTGFVDITGGDLITEQYLTIVPSACTTGTLLVLNQNAPGAGASWAYTLRVGTFANRASDPVMTCTIQNNATSCNASGAISIAANSLIDLRMVPTNRPSDGTISAAFTCQ